MVYFKALEKGLYLEMDIDPDIPCKLHGDEVRVRQIISNFLSNAVKYTREGGIILKLGFNPGEYDTIELICQVKDTGIGIREEDRDRVFSSFERVDKSLIKPELIEEVDSINEEGYKDVDVEALSEEAIIPGMGELSSAGIDVNIGLEYCMNDKSFYKDILMAFADVDRAKELELSFGKRDYENYRVAVHAMKSTSLTIGATKLSEKAKEMEKACREADTAYIIANHKSLVERYYKIYRTIKELFFKNSIIIS